MVSSINELLKIMKTVCLNNNPVVCYGAGWLGSIVYRYLRKQGVYVTAFAVSDDQIVPEKIEDCDAPVYSLQEALSFYPDAFFLISVTAKFKRQLERNLNMKGVVKYGVVSDGMINQMLADIYMLEKNKKLKNTCTGERCFILCNGPSVRHQHLERLKNETVFSCSFANLLPFYDTFLPKYYVSPSAIGVYKHAEGIYGENAQKEMSQKTFVENIIKEYVEFLQKDIKSNIIILDLVDKEEIDKYGGLPENKEVYYLFQTLKWNKNRRNIYDLSGAIPGVATAPIMMLNIAMYIGYKEIYLLGTHHDSFAKHKYEHAYHVPQNTLRGKWHNMDENSVKKQKTLENMEQEINVYRQYRLIHKIADYNEVKIYNATEGGLLDEFPRVSFDELPFLK